MSVQIETTKQVPLYFYKCIYTPNFNGRHEYEKEYYFKTTIKHDDLIAPKIAKALGITLGPQDCIHWDPISPREFFENMPEV